MKTLRTSYSYTRISLPLHENMTLQDVVSSRLRCDCRPAYALRATPDRPATAGRISAPTFGNTLLSALRFRP